MTNKKTDYETYLRTEELLALQKHPEKMACHDELQFQVVHQVSELWMKLVLFEFEGIKKHLKAESFFQAHTLFTRCVEVLRLLTSQLKILNTMSPSSYHQVRTQLGKGSGQESPGFNLILKEGPTLWPVFSDLLKKRNLSVADLHDHPESHPDLFTIAEDLFAVDEEFLNFKHGHLQLVKRIIGGDVPSLKGVHAEKYLLLGLAENFFPELWNVRNEISKKRGIPVGAKIGLCPYSHK